MYRGPAWAARACGEAREPDLPATESFFLNGSDQAEGMYDSFENMAAVQVVKLITAAKCLHNGGPFLVSLASPPVHRMVPSTYDEARDPDLNTTLLKNEPPCAPWPT